MKLHRFAPALAGAVLAALLAGCGGAGSPGSAPTSQPDAAASAASGSESADALSFEAHDMDGTAVTQEVLAQSRLTMVNVWATYCGPCLREMPDLGALSAEYDAADFQIIGIVSDVTDTADEDTKAAAADLIAETGAAYPHLLLNQSLYDALLTDVTAVPTTYFIDAEGNLLDTVVGSQSKAAWKEKIDDLLAAL